MASMGSHSSLHTEPGQVSSSLSRPAAMGPAAASVFPAAVQRGLDFPGLSPFTKMQRQRCRLEPNTVIYYNEPTFVNDSSIISLIEKEWLQISQTCLLLPCVNVTNQPRGPPAQGRTDAAGLLPSVETEAGEPYRTHPVSPEGSLFHLCATAPSDFTKHLQR